MAQKGIGAMFANAHLLDGARTPFADYNGALANASPIDLGIKAARAAIARASVPPSDIGTVIAYLPPRLDPVDIRLLTALAARVDSGAAPFLSAAPRRSDCELDDPSGSRARDHRQSRLHRRGSRRGR